MKAVYLLICLALPSHIAGHIFRKNKAIYWPANSDFMMPYEPQMQDHGMESRNQEWDTPQHQRSLRSRYEDISYQTPENRLLKSRDQNSQERQDQSLRTLERNKEHQAWRNHGNKDKTVFVTIVRNNDPSENLNIEINKLNRHYPLAQRSLESKEISPEDIYSEESGAQDFVFDDSKEAQDTNAENPQSKTLKNKIKAHANSNSKESSQESQEKHNLKSVFSKESMESREHPPNNNYNNNVNVHNTGLRRLLPNNWPLFNAITNFAYPTYDSGVSWEDLEMAQEPSALTEYVKEVLSIGKKAYQKLEPKNEDKKRFHVDFETATQLNNEDVHMNATELSRKYNYNVEEHTVKTRDGYLLSILRIQSKSLQGSSENRPVAFLMHGLLGSADDWLVMGPYKSLAYYLADAGVDVWLGNVRGNKYSQRHVNRRPDQEQFWHFTNDEIASYDLPAMIDYVLQKTQKPNLFYIGHSQGTTTFFALMASRPEYNAKVKAMYALSPMAYMSYAHSPMLRLAAPHGAFYDRMHELLGHKDFKPEGKILKLLGGELCESMISCDVICSNVNFVLSGVNEARLNASDMPVFMSHLPAGTSARVIKHYGQTVSSQQFQKYSYGSANNERLYGSSSPPAYDLKQVTVPVSLYYSEDDWLAHPNDVEKLKEELSNVEEAYKVPAPWSHLDYVLSTFAPELVYQRLLASLKNYSS